MAWTIDVLSLDGATTTLEAAPFKTARATWALDGSGALEVELLPAHVAGGDWLWGRRRLLLRDPEDMPQLQGWLERLERAGAPNFEAFRASALGLASRLERRVVHGDFNQIATVATTGAWDLIQHAQAQPDGDMGFALGTIVGTAPARDRYRCDGDVVKTCIDEYANLSPGGFAWEIDELAQFNAWVGGRGTDLSGSVTLREDDCTNFEVVGDASTLSTYVTGLGASEDAPCGPPLVIDDGGDSGLADEWGRRESVVQDDTSDDEFELEERTAEELRSSAAGRLNLRTTWVAGRDPWTFGDVWLGDVVAAEVGDAFGGDAVVRLTAVTLTMEPGIYEYVECEWEAA